MQLEPANLCFVEYRQNTCLNKRTEGFGLIGSIMVPIARALPTVALRYFFRFASASLCGGPTDQFATVWGKHRDHATD